MGSIPILLLEMSVTYICVVIGRILLYVQVVFGASLHTNGIRQAMLCPFKGLVSWDVGY